MTVAYHDAAHIDTGLEWGQMWYLQLASPEMQSEHFSTAASVKRVLVARRRWRGNRTDGYVYRHFVRLSDRQYGPREYLTVLDGDRRFGFRQLFLTEAEAWDSYADWLQRYLDRKRELVRVGEQMLAEAEAMARLKKGQTT